jgi:telomere-associated protein RIF1
LIGDTFGLSFRWYKFNVLFFSLIDLIDPVTLETPLSKNLVTQISALALQLDSEDLHNYSGSQLFEMHEKLGTMANSIIRNLQSRWRSPPHENSV